MFHAYAVHLYIVIYAVHMCLNLWLFVSLFVQRESLDQRPIDHGAGRAADRHTHHHRRQQGAQSRRSERASPDRHHVISGQPRRAGVGTQERHTVPRPGATVLRETPRQDQALHRELVVAARAADQGHARRYTSQALIRAMATSF